MTKKKRDITEDIEKALLSKAGDRRCFELQEDKMDKSKCAGYGFNYTARHPKCMQCVVKDRCREAFLSKDLPKEDDVDGKAVLVAENLWGLLDKLHKQRLSEELNHMLKQIRTKISSIVKE